MKVSRTRIDRRLARRIPTLLAKWACAACIASPGIASQATQAVPATDDPAADEARTFLLLVGCTEYPALRKALPDEYEGRIRLDGPENDVELMRRTLSDTFSIRAENVTRLVGWPEEKAARPTGRNIKKALKELAERVEPGDFAIVYLSGHGSQQRAGRGQNDEELDGLDEVFLPADAGVAGGDGRIPHAITDDAIGTAIRRIQAAGAEVWLIVDSCHSGTMLRGSGASYKLRGVDPGLLGVSSGMRGGGRGSSSGRIDIGREGLEGIAAMYGAQSFGSAPEMDLPEEAADAQRHGLFTYLLARELVRGTGQTTYRELGERVIGAYQAFPCRLTVPMCEGDLDRLVATGEHVEGKRIQLARSSEGHARLNVGRLAGIEVGTTLAALGGREASAEEIARLEVVEVSLHEASCRISEGELTEDMQVFPARIVGRPLGDFGLSLCLVDSAGQNIELERLPAAAQVGLGKLEGRVSLIADPGTADWVLRAAESDLFLRPSEVVGRGESLPVAAEDLAHRLQSILKVRNLRRVLGEGLVKGLDEGLDIWIERKAPGERKGTRVEPGGVLHPGDQVQIFMQKTAQRVFDVWIFFLTSDHRIIQLFPERQGGGQFSARLEETADRRAPITGEIPVTGDSLGVEHLLVFAFEPEGASDSVDLSWLGTGSPGRTRGARKETALTALLDGVCFGGRMRGGASVPVSSMDGRASLLTMQTAWPALGPPSWPRSRRDDFVIEVPSVDDEGEGNDAEALPFDQPESAAGKAAFSRSPQNKGKTRRDLLLVGGETPRWVLVDFDGGIERPEDPAALVAGGGFDAEIALCFDDAGWLAYYDRDDRGVFDLLLVDRDRNGTSDERWHRRETGWVRVQDDGGPWMSQAHLREVPSDDRINKRGADVAIQATLRLLSLVRQDSPPK